MWKMNVIFVIFCLMQFSVACGIAVFRFGEGNGFMCHCKNTSEPCDKLTGKCTSGCAYEWFGPACQYRDLAHIRGHNVSQTSTKTNDKAGKAIDGNITTCSRTKKYSSSHWKIWLPQNETITEMYILTKDIALKNFIRTKVFVEHVSEANKNETSYKPKLSKQCSDSTPMSNPFVIKCDPPLIGNQVRIQLEGKVKLVLCDVKINGGRNLAFGKPTNQTSVLYEKAYYDSSNAVDGNHTSASWTNVSYNATWSLELGHSAILQHINIVVKENHLRNYETTLLYRENNRSHSLNNLDGRISKLYQEVTGIQLSTGEINASMTIFEVELFGDCTERLCGFDCKTECYNACDTCTIWNRMSTNYSYASCQVYDGKEDSESVNVDAFYGTPCKECGNCLNNETFDKTSGKCPSGCQPGYAGDLCNMTCENSTWGIGCNNTCGYCSEGTCNHVDGFCEGNCSIGYEYTAKCDKGCDAGFHGMNCSETCGSCLKGTSCDKVSGACPNVCSIGYTGKLCKSACENGTWVVGCNNTCSNCSTGNCDHVDGSCKDTCSIGYKYTPKCDEECDDGLHGINCSETCGSCRNGTTCNKVSGECQSGCSIGYAGNLCNTVSGQHGVAGIRIIVGVGAGVVFLLNIALIIVCVLKGRKKRRERSEDVELHSGRTHDWNTVGFSETNSPGRPKFESSRSKSGVQVAKLLQYVKMSLTSKEHIISEFQTIPYGLQYSTESAALQENIGKNRYIEIYPYEHSRVVLTSMPGVLHSDYINASFIQGHVRENAYIAAQGPMNTSVEDFWRMVWEKDVRTVVMLTNIVEEKKVKCAEYWGSPNEEKSYGTTTVSKESEHICANYTIRRFKVFSEDNRNDSRTVIQFHYTAWPDKGVPRSTSSLVQFWNVVRQADSLKSHTWLVHCSAGVGRTGTFIAMDLLYDEGDDLGTVDIHHCVQTLREQRVNMVQTKEQYKFLHALVVELLVLPSKQIHSDAFSEFYANLQSFDSHTGKSGLLLQYEGLQEETTFMNIVYESCKLQTADDKEDRFVAAKLDKNKSKNIYQSVLPANEFRPFLSTNVPDCSNYINAVYVQSYRRLRGFILTQTPTKQTAIDCCRLVIEEGIKVIVTFDYKWKGKVDVGEYLPENGSIQLGPFTSTKLAETDENNYIFRAYRIVYQSEETIVYQFIYKKWPTERIIPLDSQSVLNLIHIVDFTNRREADNAILVQCLDGAERSGLFVVLMNIMERLRYENRVSIPHLIRCARVRREQIIPNFEQYKFCHDILLSYVENRTTYANM